MVNEIIIEISLSEEEKTISNNSVNLQAILLMLAIITDGANFKFIQTVRGKTLLMINGYTYTENNRAKNTYYCSRKYKSCKSSVKFGADGRIASVKLEHNHPPPNYMLTRNGLYVKATSCIMTHPSHRFHRGYPQFWKYGA